MAFAVYRRIYVSLIILTVFAGVSLCLRCYQCIDSGVDTDCRNATLLINTTNKNFKEGSGKAGEWKRNKYYKECNHENYTMCMIETFQASDGKIKSYLRGCSDGETFSFKTEKYPILKNLPANNESTCTFDPEFAGQHICVRLCQGDMCNGPVPGEAEKVVCRNETDEFTGETTEICAATSLFHFMSSVSLLAGLYGLSVCVRFFI